MILYRKFQAAGKTDNINNKILINSGPGWGKETTTGIYDPTVTDPVALDKMARDRRAIIKSEYGGNSIVNDRPVWSTSGLGPYMDVYDSSYNVLADKFQEKYRDKVDWKQAANIYGQIQKDSTLTTEKARNDTFNKKMCEMFGDCKLTTEETAEALQSAGIPATKYGNAVNKVIQRYMLDTKEPHPYYGNNENDNLQYFGWRMFSNPLGANSRLLNVK
jgi:hypothetical protein